MRGVGVSWARSGFADIPALEQNERSGLEPWWPSTCQAPVHTLTLSIRTLAAMSGGFRILVCSAINIDNEPQSGPWRLVFDLWVWPTDSAIGEEEISRRKRYADPWFGHCRCLAGAVESRTINRVSNSTLE